MLADTFSPEVAAAALDAGAAAINDIGGGADRDAGAGRRARLRLRAHAHRGPAAGRPRAARLRRRRRPRRRVVRGRIERAAELGVDPERIALDPGLDFDLSADDDLELLRRLGELRELGRPLFVALSRKDFLGAIAAGSWERRLDAAERGPGDAGGDRARGRRGGRDAPPARRRGARRDADRRGDHGGSGMTELLDAPPLAWERLVEAGEADERLVTTTMVEPREPQLVAPPAGSGAGARPPPSTGPGSPRSTRTRSRRWRRRARGGRDRHQRHRLGQVALVQPAGPRRPGRRPEGAGALRLPDQGAGPGPGAQAGRARAGGAPPRDLRRRHPARGPAGDPAALEPGADQPGHAQHGDARPPQGLGRLPRQPRASSSSTRRTPTAASSAPTSPTCCAGCAGWRALYGSRAAVHPRLGDDRQPGRARRAASPGPSSSWSTPTAPRAPGAGSRSGTRR